VRYADAQVIAKALQELMGAQTQQVVPQGTVVVGAQRQPARVVVNAATNTLIVNTQNPDEAGQLLGLMRTLDRPAKSAMIEVTVAEVAVGSSNQLGIDWSLSPQAINGSTLIGGTAGGVGVSTGGLSLSLLNGVGDVRARLNALASANKARILSTPRVMARNGETATIQVGQEVPIITSQQTTASTTPSVPGGTGVLQTIQYRNTGVILRVKPVIFAGRVELDVQQEVSSAASTTTGVNISPTFSTRKIDTKVSIRDGATVALGGLISRNESNGDSGVPFLKDIPWAGQLFRSNTASTGENELIILITPYVIENDLVAEQVTQALRGQLGAWAQPTVPSGPWAEKLKPLPPSPVPTPAAPLLPSAENEIAPVKERETAGEAAPAPEAKAGPSAPVPAAVPAPAGAPGAFVPPGLDGGTPVTDPVLLEEFRRLREGGAPATTPPPRAAAPVRPASAPSIPTNSQAPARR